MKDIEYSKRELSYFAKQCAKASDSISTGICMGADVTTSELGRLVCTLDENDPLLIEISKRFAKYVNDAFAFNVESGCVQEFQSIIEKIYNCCNEYDLFNECD